MKKEGCIDFIIIFCLLIVSVFIIFTNLGSFPLYSWDESLFAEHALEILKTNDWITIRYNGVPDLDLGKPSLCIWLIAISFKIFGINLFALRFFSALFGVLTIILVYFFGKEMYNRTLGIIASIFMLITPGFIGYHAARTGDFDVILTFFITLCFFLFYLYEKKSNKKLLIGFWISLSAVALIKGPLGLFPLAILGLYLVFTKSIKKILNKEFFCGFLIFLIITLPWFILRFFSEAGKEFFKLMFFHFIIKRTLEPGEGFYTPMHYYIQILLANFGIIIFLLLLISIFYSLYLILEKKDKKSILLLTWFSFFLIVFTIVQSRRPWYIIPLYPAASLLIASFLDDFKKYFNINNWIFILIFLLIISTNFLTITNIILAINPDSNFNSINSIKEDLKSDKVYIHKGDDYFPAIFFYLNILTNKKIQIYNDINEIEINSSVIATNKDSIEELSKNQEFKFLKNYGNLNLFQKN
jgi:4-amino-4-deoxy-L-arabinose transferase-like glycosyltransferase